MAMKPAYSRPVGRIDMKFDDLSVGGKPRLDAFRQILKPLPRDCRNQYRPIGRRTPFGDVCEALANRGVEPVDFIPPLDQPTPPIGFTARLDAKLVQDFFDVA